MGLMSHEIRSFDFYCAGTHSYREVPMCDSYYDDEIDDGEPGCLGFIELIVLIVMVVILMSVIISNSPNNRATNTPSATPTMQMTSAPSNSAQ